jgi:hypothetical protein
MKKIIILFTAVVTIVSCNKLDVLPENIVNDRDLFGSASGVTAYMAGVYNTLPIEDFRFNAEAGDGFFQFNFATGVHVYTGEGFNKNITGMSNGARGYWEMAYVTIRQANYVLENMPAIALQSGIPQSQIDKWLGEAYFLRAFTYFALVKRYGGVPLIKTVQKYPEQSLEELQVRRSSEQETYDFIGEDCDKAYAMLGATSEQKGRANKYTAAGLKSRAMLFAGSIARYNTKNTEDPVTHARVQGINASEAIRYFKASYAAAKLVETGGYTLYRANPNKVTNFINLFFDVSATNKESLLMRQYSLSNYPHCYDAVAIPRQMGGADGYTSYVAPTLDYVELFEGFPKNADGTIKTTDDNNKYVYYDDRYSFFKDAEPRFLATVIVPGATFKGQEIDIRRGIYTGGITSGITKFNIVPYGTATAYSTVAGFTPSNNILGTPTVNLPGGGTMPAGGTSGQYGTAGAGTYSGFVTRKFQMETTPQSEVRLFRSTQPWTDMRYAEILLNRAEAAYELFLLGQSDIDYVQDAFNVINDIRDRAGAPLLTTKSNLDNINIIRKERRKELGFENKIWWDIKRWRIADTEINNRVWRVFCPIYVAANSKYIFDWRLDERNSRFTFNPSWYYEPIPGGQIAKNPGLVPNN